MKNQNVYKDFIFNEEIDTIALYELYEDDFTYIEEIFNTTLQQLQPDLEKVAGAFNSRDRETLRKAVHKIKPSFGFTGMNALQEECRNFEELCSENIDFQKIEEQYPHLWEKLDRAVFILRLELTRLKKYNKTEAE